MSYYILNSKFKPTLLLLLLKNIIVFKRQSSSQKPLLKRKLFLVIRVFKEADVGHSWGLCLQSQLLRMGEIGKILL
jgi:hypothetical protein